MDPQLNNTFVTPCVVKIWTSSHGTDRHHFPGALQTEFNSSIEKSEYMKYPLIDAKPGRLMNDRFFGQIEDDFAMIPDDTSRLNVILMGDNDIRTHGNGGGYRILNKSKKLILNQVHSLVMQDSAMESAKPKTTAIMFLSPVASPSPKLVILKYGSRISKLIPKLTH